MGVTPVADLQGSQPAPNPNHNSRYQGTETEPAHVGNTGGPLGH